MPHNVPRSRRVPPARTAAAALAGLILLVAEAGMVPTAAARQGEASQTVSLQGDQAAWIRDPHTRAFFQLTVKAFAGGADRLDRAGYERDARAIFRDFGPSMGVSAEAMEAHLALVPAQVVKIVSEDPKVLDSFDAFVAAIFGPP